MARTPDDYYVSQVNSDISLSAHANIAFHGRNEILRGTFLKAPKLRRKIETARGVQFMRHLRPTSLRHRKSEGMGREGSAAIEPFSTARKRKEKKSRKESTPSSFSLWTRWQRSRNKWFRGNGTMALIVRVAMQVAVLLRRRRRRRRKERSMTIAIFLKFKSLFETLRLCSLYLLVYRSFRIRCSAYFLINIYIEVRRGRGGEANTGKHFPWNRSYVCKFVCDRISLSFLTSSSPPPLPRKIVAIL